ncbi:histone deacetylase 15 isoform X3 [Selaginella moellendorffii]|uniref:histone deacetylase 15 isoform X3 n=1 Tax=Selaginella moellendorffii TaxID=88036 RepID=UPI000D1C5D1A|nr:histone deacetylase 15 isoform X3 [Selaginella moellendorffii]|eukprot:XP_024524977.1 histone deacetylase 15 isoform X3 [Selaginella moellendorffii]
MAVAPNPTTPLDGARWSASCESSGRDGDEARAGLEFAASDGRIGGSAKEQLLEELVYGEWDEADEEEDEDWEPGSTLELRVRWFCVNCTMPNVEESTHCKLCSEHRYSGILNQGHLAPAFTQAGTDELAKDVKALKRLSVRRTAIGYDDRMLLHAEFQMKSNPHPERPDRLRSILAGFTAAGLYPGGCILIPAREITRVELETVHTHEHVEVVEATSSLESSYFTSDTYANGHSALAARLAAGVCADLASAILSGQVDNGFALVRPPGHHAEGATVMGFCLHNNACIAAKASQAAGAKKVLIVDWDVHHGNGTQEIFEHDPSVLYISLHRHEGGLFYPGSGAAHEVGSGPGEGFSINIPWPCSGIGDNDYIVAFQHIVLPIAKQFAPDITIVSAGFDAARGDPLGGCQVHERRLQRCFYHSLLRSLVFQVTPAGFAQMTQLLSTVSGGKLLVVLEGGYNLRSISASATAVLRVLCGEAPESLDDEELLPSEAGWATVLEVYAVQSRYWSALCLPAFMKFTSQHINGHLKASKRPKRDKHPRVVARPIWWTWGRKRLVYKHWFGTRL